jgi:hypothetical protein
MELARPGHVAGPWWAFGVPPKGNTDRGDEITTGETR